MQSIGSVIQNILPFEQKVLSEEVCECGETVELVEAVFLMGPKKGEKFTNKIGCRCWEKKAAQEIMRENERNRKRRLMRIFENSSLISPSLVNSTFENYNPPSPELTMAKETCWQYVGEFDKSKGSNLLMYGPYGTGKSHLSVAIVKALMDKGFVGLFISVPDMLSKLKETYNRNSDATEADILNALKECDVLVLDDIGAEYSGNVESWAVSKVFEVVNARLGKHTIYTTNLSSTDLQAKIGGRNFSRICQDTRLVNMPGKDYRKRSLTW